MQIKKLERLFVVGISVLLLAAYGLFVLLIIHQTDATVNELRTWIGAGVLMGVTLLIYKLIFDKMLKVT